MNPLILIVIQVCIYSRFLQLNIISPGNSGTGPAGLVSGTAVDERRVGNLLETEVILMAGRQI